MINRLMTQQQTSKTNNFSGNATSRRLNELGLRLRHYLPRQIPIAVKLSFAVSMLVTLGMILLGSVVITNQEKLLRNQINAHGNTVAIQLAESAKELILADDRLSLGVLTRNMANDESILGNSVVDDKGKTLPSGVITPLQNGNELIKLRNIMDSTTHSMEWPPPATGTAMVNRVTI